MKELLPVGCVIMASGASRRFGSNKLLADFCGEPMLCRAFAATDTPRLSARIVVTRSDEVAGGMATKIGAAELCMDANIPMLVANGDKQGLLYDIVDGKQVGTLFSRNNE